MKVNLYQVFFFTQIHGKITVRLLSSVMQVMSPNGPTSHTGFMLWSCFMLTLGATSLAWNLASKSVCLDYVMEILVSESYRWTITFRFSWLTHIVSWHHHFPHPSSSFSNSYWNNLCCHSMVDSPLQYLHIWIQRGTNVKDRQTSMDIKWINRTAEEEGIAQRNMRHASERR